jgi:predicted nucleic acid-binding protein
VANVPRGVLDSDVIYSRVLHELMGRTASDALLLDLAWSAELLDEARGSLISYKGLPEQAAQRTVDYMRNAFPEGETDITAIPSGIDLSKLTKDEGDEHVCALALAAGADYLFTFDRGYLRATLKQHGVQVCKPDVFLAEQIDQEPDLMLDVLEKQRLAWAGGTHTIAELLDAIESTKTPVFAQRARDLLAP